MTLMIPSKNNRHASRPLDPVYNFPPIHDAIPYYIPFVIHYKLIIPYYVPFHFRHLLDHRCCRHPSLQDRTNTPDPLPHLYQSASFSRDSSRDRGGGLTLPHNTSSTVRGHRGYIPEYKPDTSPARKSDTARSVS